MGFKSLNITKTSNGVISLPHNEIHSSLLKVSEYTVTLWAPDPVPKKKKKDNKLSWGFVIPALLVNHTFLKRGDETWFSSFSITTLCSLGRFISQHGLWCQGTKPSHLSDGCRQWWISRWTTHRTPRWSLCLAGWHSQLRPALWWCSTLQK